MGKDQVPLAEFLKDTLIRFLPCWEEVIAPVIRSGERVIIAAHGNSLRALMKNLDDIPDEVIPQVHIPTGIPLVYELEDDLKPIRNYYLGDPEKVRKAVESAAGQATATRL